MRTLYFTGTTPDGKLLLGGVFKMQDEVGFPLDASFEECRRKGYAIDWLEALSDCWLNSCEKFDSFCNQAQSLTGNNLKDMFSSYGAMTLRKFPKMRSTPNPIDTVCRYTLAKKKLYSA